MPMRIPGQGEQDSGVNAKTIPAHSGDKATLAESLTFIQQTAFVILQAIEVEEVAAEANHA